MRGRYAPSPTGLMHLGNARTALLAWLQARRAGGSFVLRMEDIDRARSRDSLAVQLLADLRWLGLDWDEGPDKGGLHAPYVQSQRTDLYLEALQHLQAHGLVYPCFCTRAEVAAAAASAPHGAGSQGPRYPGTCRSLTPAQAAARAAHGRPPAYRFAAPPGLARFTDLVAGPTAADVEAGVGDFIVMRNDGLPAYQLAVVVDDALMGITHVLRGDDLLDSTPRQIQLFHALGWQEPAFGHVPLLIGTDGARLAKRHGDTSLAGLRAAGVRPQAIVGYLAHLSGLAPAGAELTPAELLPEFDLRRLPQAPVTVTSADIDALLR